MDGLKLQDELKQKLRLLPIPINGHPFWIESRKQLKYWLLNNDWGNFRECPVIKQTMDVGQADYCAKEWFEIGTSFNSARYIEAMDLNDKPPFQYYDNKPWEEHWTNYSGNSIHHCYHIYQWEKHSGRKVEELTSILEFGAGFGETCRIIHELGFKGKYKIIDFPEFQLLQRFYLESNEINCDNIEWTDKISGIDCSTYNDLFISEWSLSECLDKDRQIAVHIKYGNALIAYSLGRFMNAENMDNEEFFDLFPKYAYHTDKMIWKKYNTIHPDKKHNYLIGWYSND